MQILETKNLSFVYGKDTPFEKKAVIDINISIKRGEFIGIIGHTGSGKSTLIQLFNGLLKPSLGEVLLDGVNIWTNPKKIRDVRFKVGLVFQYPEYQLFEETVYKDISFGPKNIGLNPNEIDKRVNDSVEFIDFPKEHLYKSPFEISGGEKRRAAIAGIIAMKPDMLILDEPTAGLDPKGRENLINQISKYHKEKNNTIIFVSHNMDDIARISDKVLVLDKGKVSMFDTSRKVFSNREKIKEVGLDIPDITKIMIKLKDNGFNVDDTLTTIDDAVSNILNLIKKRCENND